MVKHEFGSGHLDANVTENTAMRTLYRLYIMLDRAGNLVIDGQFGTDISCTQDLVDQVTCTRTSAVPITVDVYTNWGDDSVVSGSHDGRGHRHRPRTRGPDRRARRAARRAV